MKKLLTVPLLILGGPESHSFLMDGSMNLR